MNDVVRTRIVDGVYLPGQVLNESEMAHELAVSRTPVSQALIMLRERGLVVDRHGTIRSLARSVEPAVARTRDEVHAEHQRSLAALAARDPAAA